MSPSRARWLLGGHEAQRCPTLEHRLEFGVWPSDLPEVVHDPDRVEADVVGGADGSGQGRTDRVSATRPGERAELQNRTS